MESSFLVKISYNRPTKLPCIKWQQDNYPVYEEILNRVRYLALQTDTDLGFFEKYATAIVEENDAVYNFTPEVYSLSFPENYLMTA